MLEGVRIVDFSQYLPGPHATARLVELGAEVIKIESPAGDPARAKSMAKGEGVVFDAQNRAKKSIVLNLKQAVDVDVAKRLLAEADIIIEGFRPGVMARLGLSYDDVRKLNHRIVYCSLTGYGQTGVMSQMGGHDLNYLALSGVLSQLTTVEQRPIQPSTTLADFIGGITASEAILAAYIQRLRTNEGAYVDISITDATLAVMSNHFPMAQRTGYERGLEKLDTKHVCYTLYETSDGRFVALGALEPKFWHNFCDAVERPQWRAAHFAPAGKGEAVYEDICAMFRQYSFAYWQQFSLTVDCCLTPVLHTKEVPNYPQFQQRALWTTQGDTNYVRLPYASHEQQKQAPALGAHTDVFIQQLL